MNGCSLAEQAGGMDQAIGERQCADRVPALPQAIAQRVPGSAVPITNVRQGHAANVRELDGSGINRQWRKPALQKLGSGCRQSVEPLCVGGGGVLDGAKAVIGGGIGGQWEPWAGGQVGGKLGQVERVRDTGEGEGVRVRSQGPSINR